MPTKYIVVLGSLMSGLGKGIVSSSITKIMLMHGLKALPMKFDGYLNYDCGTMNPFRHGEVFVLDDKGEVDMDFGNYERFINMDLDSSLSITGGKLFSEIISKERKGEFLGRDVQIIPHMTDFILNKVKSIAGDKKLDIMVIEVGGTVGDIENSYFIEAMRQLALKEKVAFVNVVYVPELKVVGEQKTKPTQLAIRELMGSGIQSHFIVCRSERALDRSAKERIALFSNLDEKHIIDNTDLKSIYDVPASLIGQGFDKLILEELDIEGARIDNAELSKWNEYAKSISAKHKRTVKISIVGKYITLRDSYASVKEALTHSAGVEAVNLDLNWIESERLEGTSDNKIGEILGGSDGILVPGGFGSRGIEGMIKAIKFARENKIPYLGLCLGMQLMSIEFARNVCGIKDANSGEFNPSAKDKVIDLMESQKDIKSKGGTMRLGAWKARIRDGTYAYQAYKSRIISERHRHRYEFNNHYADRLEKKGLVISARTLDGNIVEMVEWKGQFGIGTQAHPELKSRLEKPAPLFLAFIEASIGKENRP